MSCYALMACREGFTCVGTICLMRMLRLESKDNISHNYTKTYLSHPKTTYFKLDNIQHDYNR